MFESCLNKQRIVKEAFLACPDEEARYQMLMEWGRQLSKLEIKNKIPERIVPGCQSIVYLHSFLADDMVIFEAESDALISAGLAALLIKVYSGEPPESILKCPPHYLEELGLSTNLTPNRANGLYSIHLRMKQDALKLLIASERRAKE